MTKHIHVGLPCYGGMLHAGTSRSITVLALELREAGIDFTLDYLVNESLITRARNTIVENFRRNKEATHLLFVDSDILFRPEDVIKMLGLGHDLVCGAYPKKCINWDHVRKAAKADEDDLGRFAAQFVINPIVDAEKVQDGYMPSEADGNGCVAILDGATGFMLLSRECIDKMVAAYPETRHLHDMHGDRTERYALFDCAIIDGRYLSEDYLFSRRWQKIGGKVWCYLGAILGHVGSYTFLGDITTLYKPMPGAA
jgi:hypothetical protein